MDEGIRLHSLKLVPYFKLNFKCTIIQIWIKDTDICCCFLLSFIIYCFLLCRYLYNIHVRNIINHNCNRRGRMISWEEASQHCEEKSGHLISIQDDIEMNVIFNMLRNSQNMILSVYIGLYRKVCVILFFWLQRWNLSVLAWL